MKEIFLTNDIDMDACLFSGQTFRWQRRDYGFIGSADNNAAMISSLADGYRLCWEGPADSSFWQNYFDTARDYDAVAAKFADDSRVANAFAACKGLRVLNQPPWETLCGFIVSANNNDKRIRMIMHAIAKTLGDEVEIAGEKARLFPSAQSIADAGAQKLRELGAGYRDEYLADTARRVADGYDLEHLRVIGYEAALKELMTFKGVGEKVADCILLFAYGYSCAFPVDVWVERVMQSLYDFQGNRKQIKQKSAALFGNDAGIVQQMLFHSARIGSLSL